MTPHVKESRDRWFIALTLLGIEFTQQQIADEFEISKDAAKKLIRRARQWRDEYPHEFFQTAANHPGTLFGGDEAPMETLEEPEPTITLPPVRRFSYRPAVAEERKLRGRHVLEARNHHRLEDYIDDVLISS